MKMQINKKFFTWAASTIAIVVAPIAVFAWSVNSTHFPIYVNNKPKPINNVNNISTSSSNSVADSITSHPTDEPSDFNSDIKNGSTQNNSSTNVTFNNRVITVPSNGMINQTIVGNDGQATYVSVQNHSSASAGSNNNSTNLNISSTSSTSSSDSQ